jgi:hypothetical protein
VEREPLRRARADPRQARQLGDEVLDGGREHGAIVPLNPVVAAPRIPAMARYRLLLLLALLPLVLAACGKGKY